MRKFYIVEQNARSEGGHYFNYTRVIAKAAAAHGLDVIVLSNRHFDKDYGLTGVRSVKTFSYTWTQAEWQAPKARRDGMFSFDLARALDETGARAGDIVFIHTIGNEELKTLLRLFTEMPPDLDGLTFHLLLRYDTGPMRAAFPLYRRLFGRLAKSFASRRNIVFHSDTGQLARLYGAFSGLPFGVAPIPFEQSHLRALLAQDKAVRDESEPLIVAYVGDARREKRYQALPDVVARTFADPDIGSRVRFILQSNFNVDNGEAGIADARTALEAFGGDRVELSYDQMTPEDYYGLIHRADIILVPYDAKQYASRSSGILVEAMAAGKPVLVTEGSWMASQVDGSHAVGVSDEQGIFGGLKELVLDYDRFREGARRKQPAMLEHSSGDAFIAYLMDATPPVSAMTSDGAEADGNGDVPKCAGQSYRDLLGIGSLGELVASAGPERQQVSWAALIDEGVISGLEGPSELDLFFVGADTASDQEGLRRFLHDCYAPYLEAMGVSMIVAGSVDLQKAKAGLASDLPLVFGVGPVENPAPLYSAAKMVILPDWDGTGQTVKMAEALSCGVPVVATPAAVRGAEKALSGLCVGASPEAFAGHIKTLLSSADRRQQAAVLSVEAYNRSCQQGRFRAAPDAPRQAEHVEADADLFRINRMIVAWIKGHTIKDLTFELNAAKAEPMLAEYRRLLTGETSIYDVPMLATHPTFGLTILNCQTYDGFLARFDAFTRRVAAGDL